MVSGQSHFFSLEKTFFKIFSKFSSSFYVISLAWKIPYCLSTNHNPEFRCVIHYLHNPIIHLFYPPKILHHHCLQVLLGHEDVLREIKNNAYANFWGVKEVYYGVCASSEFCIGNTLFALVLHFHALCYT